MIRIEIESLKEIKFLSDSKEFKQKITKLKKEENYYKNLRNQIADLTEYIESLKNLIKKHPEYII